MKLHKKILFLLSNAWKSAKGYVLVSGAANTFGLFCHSAA